MNRFTIHRGCMTEAKIRRLATHMLATRCAVPCGEYRGWSIWICDGKAWFFKGQRVLECCWYRFCDYLRGR